MGWDHRKARLWFVCANPSFGGVSPKFLVGSGRGHRVLQFIQTAEDENKKAPPISE